MKYLNKSNSGFKSLLEYLNDLFDVFLIQIILTIEKYL